jgi:hypothetical protein
MDPAAEKVASEGLKLNQGIFKIPKSLDAVGMHLVSMPAAHAANVACI